MHRVGLHTSNVKGTRDRPAFGTSLMSIRAAGRERLEDDER
jgi:hypothetical protein